MGAGVPRIPNCGQDLDMRFLSAVFFFAPPIITSITPAFLTAVLSGRKRIICLAETAADAQGQAVEGAIAAGYAVELSEDAGGLFHGVPLFF